MPRIGEYTVSLSTELEAKFLDYVELMRLTQSRAIRRALVLYLAAVESDKVILVKSGISTEYDIHTENPVYMRPVRAPARRLVEQRYGQENKAIDTDNS